MRGLTVSSSRRRPQSLRARRSAVPKEMKIARTETKVIATGIARWAIGGDDGGAVQRLLNVADKVDEVTQSGGLIAQQGGRVLKCQNMLANRRDNVGRRIHHAVGG